MQKKKTIEPWNFLEIFDSVKIFTTQCEKKE